MRDSIYMVFDRCGLERTRKSIPEIGVGEIAIKVNVKIDNSWFKKFIPVATMDVPETAVIGDGLEIDFTKVTDSQLDQLNSRITLELAERPRLGEK